MQRKPGKTYAARLERFNSGKVARRFFYRRRALSVVPCPQQDLRGRRSKEIIPGIYAERSSGSKGRNVAKPIGRSGRVFLRISRLSGQYSCPIEGRRASGLLCARARAAFA